MPVYSVLLPTHNRSDVLPYAIRAVLDQTFDDFELLIVGDGCTDNTSDVVRQFNDARIRWFDLPKGPGFGYANRNLALREAKGELIAFAAHDDLYFPDHLESMARLFANQNVQWAYSLGIWVQPNGICAPIFKDITLADEMESFFKQENFIPALNVVHRRGCYNEVGFWPEESSGSGDWVLWKRIIEFYGPECIRYLPVPTGLHFQANWRTSGISLADNLAVYAQSCQWWPPELAIQLNKHQSEQSQVDLILREGGDTWLDHFRKAVIKVCFKLAQETTKSLAHFESSEILLNTLRKMTSEENRRTKIAEHHINLAISALNAKNSTPDLHTKTFDEIRYLSLHKDVADAVANGVFSSGLDHWLMYGIRENRKTR